MPQPTEARDGAALAGYLCAGGAKTMFVAAADHSMLPVPSRVPQTSRLLKIALSAREAKLLARRHIRFHNLHQWHRRSVHQLIS